MASVQQFVTIGDIAQTVGRPIHQVNYVIKTRRIPSCGRAGTTRVFDVQAVERIRAELQRIVNAKEVHHG
jgi:hypothetical protein